jgi:hypothetical protein
MARLGPDRSKLTAWEARQVPITPRPDAGTYVLAWAFLIGAGDGNRTRAISLGSHCQPGSTTCGDFDLCRRVGLPASDRESP